MSCVIKYKGLSIPEENFIEHLQKLISINDMFDNLEGFADGVYEELGFNETDFEPKLKTNPVRIGARFPKDQIKANYADGIIAYGTHSTGKYAEAFGGTRTSFKEGEVIMISVNGNNRPNQKENVEKTKRAIDQAISQGVSAFIADNKIVANSSHNSGGEGVIREYLLSKGLIYKDFKGVGLYIVPKQSVTNLPTSDQTINIYAGTNENAELSNFAIRPFTINVETPSGEKQYTFQSVEQGFHFHKALIANNPQVAKQILATTNGGQLRRLTNRSNLKMTPEQVKEWDDTSKSIMLNLMYESYAQNPKAAEKLLATGNAKITHIQDNTRWKTDFPDVVMTVRDMLREEGFGIQSQITPQQKQKAIQIYSRYITEDVEGVGLKNWIKGIKTLDYQSDLLNLGDSDEILYQIPDGRDVEETSNIKSEVEKLFNENHELANAVYEALGFIESNRTEFTEEEAQTIVNKWKDNVVNLRGNKLSTSELKELDNAANALFKKLLSLKGEKYSKAPTKATLINDLFDRTKDKEVDLSEDSPINTLLNLATRFFNRGFYDDDKVTPEQKQQAIGPIGNLLAPVTLPNGQIISFTPEDAVKHAVISGDKIRATLYQRNLDGSYRIIYDREFKYNPNKDAEIRREIKEGIDAILESKDKGYVDIEEPVFRLALRDFEGLEDVKAFTAWMKENLPQIPVNIVTKLIHGKAWGMFYNGAITLYDKAEIGTGFHEAFHAVWDSFLTWKEKYGLLNEFKSRKGEFTNPFTGETKKYKDATYTDAVEMMAEEFRKYMLRLY